jgi:NAD(P)H dehydrogenase (quinone)
MRLLIKSICFALLSLCVYNPDIIAQKAPAEVLVVYHSRTGNTRLMAEAVANGAARIKGVNVKIKTIEETQVEDLLNAGAIILGCPVTNANPSPEMLDFIASWPFDNAPLKNKLGAAFVTAGGISSGEETTQLSLLKAMLIYGMIVLGGDDWQSPFGASAVTYEAPFGNNGNLDPIFISKAEKLGARVAETLLRITDR